MKKQFALLCLLAAFIVGCGNDPKEIVKEELAIAKPVVSNFEKLDKLFKDLTTDTLYVYSSDNGDDKNYRFRGQLMDSAQVFALPAEEHERYKYTKDYFACYKFSIDTNRTAFLARTPGEYSSTVLSLFIFDKRRDSVVKTIDLSDVFGDAGELFFYNSCLVKNTRDPFILTYYYSSYDHNVNGEANDTIIEQTNGYYLRGLINQTGDTLSKDSAMINNKYSHIVRKLTN